MQNEIKSGTKVLEDFFSNVKENDTLDTKTRDLVVKLYSKGKLTKTNLSNELEKLREQEPNDEDK